jgi:hypothetical protein
MKKKPSMGARLWRFSVPFNGDSALLGNAFGNAGAIFHVARQLAASRINVIPTCFAHRGDKSCLNEDAGELFNRCVIRAQQTRGFKRIERNQIKFASQSIGCMSANELHQSLSVFDLIVHVLEHAVLKGDEVSGRLAKIERALAQKFV